MGTHRDRAVVTLLLALSLPLTLSACGDSDLEDTTGVARAVAGALPDLATTAVSEPPGQIVVGATFNVTDTTANLGAGPSVASVTRFYLSPDGSKGNGLVPLTSGRSVAVLAAGGASTGTTTVTVAAGTNAGPYFLMACADRSYTNNESNESNNCVASLGTVQVNGPDLRVSAMSEPPAQSLLGSAFTVTDTVQSAGTMTAPASSIQFYLSTDMVRSSNDRALKPARSFAALEPGAESSGSTDLTAPAGTASGAYYLLGCVDVASLITETDENNCAVSTGQVIVTAADLVSADVSAPATVIVGANFEVTDTVANVGDGAAGASTTRYYLSLDSLRSSDDKLLTGTRAVGTIDAAGTSTGSTLLSVPTGTPAGSYRVLACADGLSTVAESDENNNCVVASSVTNVIGADLVTSSVGPIPAVVPVGGSFAVTDQVDNVGDADAGASVTQYVLSVDTLRNAGDKALGGRRLVAAIAAHGSSSGTSTVIIPAGTAPGTYYLLVCADDVPKVAETSDSNNCTASATTFAIGLPDLVVQDLGATTAFPGDTTIVTATVRNVGFSAAAATTARFYLSTDATRSVEDTALGSRYVPTLAAGAGTTSSNPFTIAYSVVPGDYFVIACADDDGVVTEGDESNCVATPLSVVGRCDRVVCAPSDACHLAGQCNPLNGQCSNPVAPEGTACSDGNACSVGDSCHAGVCSAGAPLVCDDGNGCTQDTCDPASGCAHANLANGTSCSDGSACTVDDVCVAGACVGGAPLACNDGNSCTEDTCDPASGCVATAVLDGTGCSDGSACTLGDSCQAGTCVGGEPLSCDDHNGCTADTCDPTRGCVATAVADGTTCSDGSACTDGDVCQAGQCQAGAPVVCDDHNGCTTDSCDPAQGCVATAVADGTSCADGDHCNGAETCRAGTCSPGAPDNGGCDPVATCTSVPDGRTCACPDGTVDTHGDGTECAPAADCDTVTAVAAGAYHSCALVANGTVRCWGYNSSGQIGDGSMGNFGRLSPVTVSGLSGVVALAAAQFQTCALLGDGTVRCWGDNTYGQLGDGTTTNRPTPVAVEGLAGVTSLAVGDNHVCAALLDGTVRCWGNNFNGQLGTWGGGFTGTPTEVPGLTGALQVTAAQYHTCAALLDGTVKCWGANGFGQLGDGTGADSASPVSVLGLTGAVQVAASASHSCALLGDGTVRCWGRNLDGQLGDGTGSDRYSPVPTINLTGATGIATGQHHSCAVVSDGSVRCWGGSWEGMIGYGGTAGSVTPLAAVGVTAATHVTGGWFHTCAIDGGHVRCWGSNQFGGLGDGTTNRSLVPNDPIALSCE